MTNKKILITGCRGIPAQYGGFETFAERLALYLVSRNWDVTVYCQREKSQEHEKMNTEMWKGIRLVQIPVAGTGPVSTIVFDYQCIQHAMKEEGIVLTLGYNTALFNTLLAFKKRRQVINLGGIEWQRPKWPWHGKAWLWLNEWLAPKVADGIVADHPEIKKHILTRGARQEDTLMIPYGADPVTDADPALIEKMHLKAGQYALVIARPEPENQILEIVHAFSRKGRGLKLVVLGNLDDNNPYHRQLRLKASDEVVFTGGIYNKPVVASLRQYCRAYIHGHTVGGTNPSLVEAMAAGNVIIAHNNPFNRWVAGKAAMYFKDKVHLAKIFDEQLYQQDDLQQLKSLARQEFQTRFTWDHILGQYEKALQDLAG